MQMGHVKYNCAAGLRNMVADMRRWNIDRQTRLQTRCVRLPQFVLRFKAPSLAGVEPTDGWMTSSQILTLCTSWHVNFDSFVVISLFFSIHPSTLIIWQ